MRSGGSGGGGGCNKSNDQSLPDPHQLHLDSNYDEGDDEDANDDGHGQGPPHPEMSLHHLTQDFQQWASEISIFSSFFLFCIFAILCIFAAIRTFHKKSFLEGFSFKILSQNDYCYVRLNLTRHGWKHGSPFYTKWFEKPKEPPRSFVTQFLTEPPAA